MFPDLDEGGLATYRSSLVQNKHLAVLAKVKLKIIFSYFTVFTNDTGFFAYLQ